MINTAKPINSYSESHLSLARHSLQQAVTWYNSVRRYWQSPPSRELLSAIRPDLQQLKLALDKLDHPLFKIAVFGLVSRGKSAVINALMGQKLLETGAIHGVTQWTHAVRWLQNDKLIVDLIDTPGLDEISGEKRGELAKEVAKQADLILFVVSGDITRTEYQAISELRENQKPILLVFNKIDLYPEIDQHKIYQQLQKLGLGEKENQGENSLTPDEIVCVSADPQAIPVRVEWEDGTVTQEWESPPPQIESLREILFKILNREGRSLLAINALFQAKQAEENIAKKTIEYRQEELEKLLNNYMKYKSLVVGLNPLGIVDMIGGFIVDLNLIRSIARLYGLPITSYQAGQLWKNILFSSGTIAGSELLRTIVFSLGKLGGLFTGNTELGVGNYLIFALLQGSIAGYGSYRVGKSAQIYLEKGCSWGIMGVSTVIETILKDVDPNTLLYRLRQKNSSVPLE